ncbi:MAG: hypothetical protein NC084_08220 [Bacteroides sp.]|nr:hypothetical protein [Eubacterium sp.]MCM1418627.1 hypothetical protein [Roseburia sp.]MCM1462681.1 hypothetical protein [Bacteroides sp.]
MELTKEQREVITFLKDHQETIAELLSVSALPKRAKELSLGESVSFAGLTWSKFAEDRVGNAYMLADKKLFDLPFGKRNDWRESPIRRILNDELAKRIADALGSDALVPIRTDLFSLDGSRDYGKCEDRVALLTYDLYRENRESIKPIARGEAYDEWYWTCTPDAVGETDGAVCIDADGAVTVGLCQNDDRGGVRPFCILRAEARVGGS